MRVWFITGESRGFGALITQEALNAGDAVVATERNPNGLAQKFGNHPSLLPLALDVSNETQAHEAAAEAVERFGKIDILINNAGVYAFVPLEEITAEEYARQYNTNVLGLLQATREAVKYFPAEGGSVVNISSIASTFAPPTTSIYSGTKGAVDTITKVLAKELAPKKIRVNAINPGYVVTEGTEKVGVTGSPQEEFFISITPLGRAGQPEDIALPTSFLVSDDARWITGEIIKVGGGAGI